MRPQMSSNFANALFFPFLWPHFLRSVRLWDQVQFLLLVTLSCCFLIGRIYTPILTTRLFPTVSLVLLFFSTFLPTVNGFLPRLLVRGGSNLPQNLPPHFNLPLYWVTSLHGTSVFCLLICFFPFLQDCVAAQWDPDNCQREQARRR